MSLQSEWKQHPITEDLVNWIDDEIERTKEAWSSQQFLNEYHNIKALGIVEALKVVKENILTVDKGSLDNDD